MKPSIDEIFKLSLNELEDSEFRFFVNRSRSVVIMSGSEFDDNIVPSSCDIYMLYNDLDRNPVLISITALKEDDVVKDFKHDDYKISYRSEDGRVLTYLREDALTILDEKELKAVEKYSTNA